MPGGRPPKLTPAVVGRILDAVRAGASYAAATAAVGVSYRAWRLWAAGKRSDEGQDMGGETTTDTTSTAAVPPDPLTQWCDQVASVVESVEGAAKRMRELADSRPRAAPSAERARVLVELWRRLGVDDPEAWRDRLRTRLTLGGLDSVDALLGSATGSLVAVEADILACVRAGCQHATHPIIAAAPLDVGGRTVSGSIVLDPGTLPAGHPARDVPREQLIDFGTGRPLLVLSASPADQRRVVFVNDAVKTTAAELAYRERERQVKREEEERQRRRQEAMNISTDTERIQQLEERVRELEGARAAPPGEFLVDALTDGVVE